MCPLLPGGQGQWIALALQLSPTAPYLMLWPCIMIREGSDLASQRQLLEALGYLPKYHWGSSTPGAKIVTPVSLCLSSCVYRLYR